MKRFRNLFAFSLACVIAAQPCWGWGSVGHRVVGRVAAALLDDGPRNRVADILGVSHTKNAVADAMAEAAEWPDAVARDEFPQASPWHFIDLGVKANAAKDNPLWSSPDTAFARIVKFFDTVKRRQPDELEPGSDLKFLIHLVGDVHQPLHSATNQDRGGNCLRMQFVQDDGNLSPITKFHMAWDRAMLEDRLGRDDRAIARQLVRQWKNLTAAQQAAKRAPDPAGDAQAATRKWIEEAHQLAVAGLYGRLAPAPGQFESAEVASDCKNAAPIYKTQVWKLEDTAVDQAASLMEEQLTKAGVRLAKLLNLAAH